MLTLSDDGPVVGGFESVLAHPPRYSGLLGQSVAAAAASAAMTRVHPIKSDRGCCVRVC